MNTEHGNPAVVMFTWDAGNLWGKMRRCLDMAIDDAKGEEKKIKFVAEGNFKEIKVAIKITGNTTETDFREKFLDFHDDFKNGEYPNLRAIVVFADIPNACLVNSCKKEMDYFLSRNIPIISSICGRQSLLKKGYFNCWCPSIETVARYAAYIIGNEFAVRAKRWHPRIWCFYTNNDFGKKSKSIFTNWLFRTQKIGSDLVQCRLANEKCLSRDKIDSNDLVFITGFGKDYEYCTSNVVGAVEDSVYLLFDQSIADPENYLGDSGYEEYKSESYEARQISYIDFVLPFNGFQRFNERTDKFKVLPYVTFRLVDQILSSSDTFKELNTLPLIEVDGISYLMTKRHERIYAAISLLEGKLERTKGRLIEKKMLFRDDSGMVAVTQERIGLLLQAVDDQLKNVSLKVSEEILLQVANEIENVFRLSLRDCDFALRLPVSVDGSKEYVSGNERLQAIARGITKIHDLGLYKNIIKISLCKQDFAEDNDIAGLYIKTAESDSPIPLKYWDEMAIVESVVLSRDIENDECDGSYDFQYVPDKQCRKICNDLLLEILKCSINNRWHFLYFIPYEMSSGSMGILLIATKLKFSYLDGRVLTAVASQIFSSVASGIKSKGILLASTKSAIGSIMSRNGSHNIGSHVLAALSHNVGTMPDDQVLYQYIQHRMDYIATATTERPTWSQPTKFVGEMVKRFLSQRHLLNFISRSEGLKAWEFQSGKAQIEGNGGRIKFHVRKVARILQKIDSTPKSDGAKSCPKLVDDLDVVKDFIDYSEKTPAAIGLEHDVSLAIPGGVVGQHAFFTIIENIVRNAAKHDWSTPPKSTRCLKYESLNAQADVTKLNPPGCLDVYIDYEDTPEDLDAQFVIWTRLSDVYSADKERVYNEVAGLTDGEVDDWLEKESLKGLPLHEHQQVELARPFIGEDGSLRRENWGMAEMKISAGYLQKAAIEAIGGVDKKGRSIITPCAVPDSWAHNKDDVNKLNDEDRKELNKVYHLGYRFNVPKSKLILFLVGKRPEKLSEKLEVELQRGGIYISLLENVDGSTELSYQYVVMDEFCGDTLKWMLPFRIIVTQCCDSCVESKVPLLFGQTSGGAAKKIHEYLDEVISASKGDSKKIGSRLQESICACWVRHLVSKRGFDGPGVSLRVSTMVSSQDTSSGKSLATPEDVVEFAFNEGLEKALDTYEVACKDVEGFLVNKKIIDVLRGLKDHIVYERQGEVSKKDDKKQEVCDYSLYIKRQLKKWLEPYVGSDPDIRGAVAFLSDETSTIEELEKSANAEMDKLDALAEGSVEYKEQRRKWSDIYDKLQTARNALVSPIASLVLYLDSYCAQIQGLLSKYAEKIATLPKGFSIGSPQDEFNCDWPDANICAWSKDAKRSVLRYWRHETKKNDSDDYLEALSGTQSYLSTLEKISNKDYPLISRLVENALLRILIIDERTREFLEKHDSMMLRFENMGIFVANDKKVDAELELLEKGCFALEVETNDAVSSGFVNLRSSVIFDIRDGYKRYEDPQAAKRKAIEAAKVRFSGKYDAIIIHQGIIDKWLPGASHDPQKVAAFIQSLKSVFHYVVITTGRGTPANIPHSARVLPFSTIQTTLFKQYPEKMILTDAIMNILPVKAVKKGVDNG